VARRLSVALVVLGLLAVPSPALAAVASPPTVVVEPASAPPGAAVSLSGSGYPLSQPGPVDCQVLLAGRPAQATCAGTDAAKGGVEATATVPLDAVPGPDQLLVLCVGKSCGRTALTVLTPAVQVPDVVGLRRDDATKALAAVGLRSTLDGSGRVIRQRPRAGSTAPPDSVVALTLRPDVPPRTLVTVPDLSGRTLRDASTRLGRLGLVLSPSSPSDAVVAGQRPRAGSRVARGSAVTVSLVLPPVDEQSGSSSLPALGLAALAGAALVAAVLAGLRLLRRRPPPAAATCEVVPVPGEPHLTLRLLGVPPLSVAAHVDDDPLIELREVVP
jgi:PASTA domain